MANNIVVDSKWIPDTIQIVLFSTLDFSNSNTSIFLDKLLWNNSSNTKMDAIDVNTAGSNIFKKYSKKSKWNIEDKYILVGLPIDKTILQVFAAVNSITRYGIGFILPFLEKYNINGVNVNMTISFEVNMVMIDINVYKTKNSMYWLFLYLSMNIDAIYLKKPASSSEIDIKDMEMNNTNIFNGFNSLLDIKLLK